MADQDFTIRWYDMAINGFGGKFVVCKLRRVSSPPILSGSVSNAIESSFLRLVDLVRLGRSSRNFQDLKAIEWALAPDYMESAEAEWAEYEKVICRVLGVERVEPFRATTLSRVGSQLPTLAVSFHEAEMNDRPYVVGRVGAVMGSPAPFYLTHPHHRESALARLTDVFRIGVRGQAFRDFVEAGRRLDKQEGQIIREWQEYRQAVSWEMRAGRGVR